MATRARTLGTILTCRISPLLQGSRHVSTTAAVLGTRKAVEISRKIQKTINDEIDVQGWTLPAWERTMEHGPIVRLRQTGDRDILDFSKNSYLGLGTHPEVVQAARDALDEFGVGIGNVRAGHGTFNLHKVLERGLTEFHERDSDTIRTCVFPTGYHANLALFHMLADEQDVILSDSLIHGTAIHGMMLCKAKKVVFKNNDMEDLEAKLQANMDKRQRVIAVDGVYSMDGFCAKLQEIRILADQYDALVMMDDAHGVGIVGEHGKGAEEYMNAMNSADIITSSLCKGLTPAGGYVTANKELIHMIRNRSGSYIFSTALTPSNTAAAIQALKIAQGPEGHRRRSEVRRLSKWFKTKMKEENFFVSGEEDMPIASVIFPEDGGFMMKFALELLEHGVLALGVTVPSAPLKLPRIRNVIAGFHTDEHVQQLLDTYVKVGKKLGRTQ